MSYAMLLHTLRRFSGSIFFAIAMGVAANGVTAPLAEEGKAQLPGDSIYQLPASLTDQDGQTFNLSSLRGRPVIVSMFYHSCQFVCPMLIDTLRMTQDSLPPEERGRVSFLIVTFDPARDDVAVLKSVAEAHKLDRQQWTVARTNPIMVRKLAAVLGIQFRLLANGDYNHSTTLILLDAQGRIVGRTAKLGAVDNEFRQLVQQTAQRK